MVNQRPRRMQLTSGMAEEKAALLVRKFFGNSIIEPKKSRIERNVAPIAEESELTSLTTLTSLASTQDHSVVDSFDSEQLLQQLCALSDFGSSQDALDDADDPDDDLDGCRSIRTASTVLRYSSCSERSVRLSDIIDRSHPEPSAPVILPLAEQTPNTVIHSFSTFFFVNFYNFMSILII